VENKLWIKLKIMLVKYLLVFKLVIIYFLIFKNIKSMLSNKEL